MLKKEELNLKKMKRAIKKMPKITIAFTVILAMLLGYMVPLTKIFASDEYVLAFTVSGDHTMVASGNSLAIDGQYLEIKNGDNENIGTVACTDATHCTITVSSGQTGYFNFNSANKFTLFIQGHEVDPGYGVSANENVAVQDYVELEPGVEPGEDEPNFDGKAYVVWSCGNGTCYHYFDDIPNFDDGNSTFYKNTDVKADNDNSISFNVKATYKDWILKEDFERWVEAYKEKYNVNEINWANVDPDLIIGNPPDMRQWEDAAINAGVCTRENTPQDDFERCVDGYMAEHSDALPFVKLQPVGEPSDNNAYVSYGDRNFKVVIYNDDFKGIAMGNLDELNYYPATWTNPFLVRDQFDISGTTKDNPTLMDSILLESTVIIKPLNYNSFKIASMEALDVPEDAVEIRKDGEEFKLIFSSNFYDNVEFKVTDTDGEVSYIQVKRYTIDGWIGHIDNQPTLIADFYFDRNKSYTDFDLSAKIIYKDGTSKNVELTPKFGVDDGLGNFDDSYEVDEQGVGGKGLKHSTFIYELEDDEDRTIQDVYLNAEYKGSTISNYAGAYVGSGKGVLANIYHPEEEED